MYVKYTYIVKPQNLQRVLRSNLADIPSSVWIRHTTGCGHIDFEGVLTFNSLVELSCIDSLSSTIKDVVQSRSFRSYTRFMTCLEPQTWVSWHGLKRQDYNGAYGQMLQRCAHDGRVPRYTVAVDAVPGKQISMYCLRGHNYTMWPLFQWKTFTAAPHSSQCGYGWI